MDDFQLESILDSPDAMAKLLEQTGVESPEYMVAKLLEDNIGEIIDEELPLGHLLDQILEQTQDTESADERVCKLD